MCCHLVCFSTFLVSPTSSMTWFCCWGQLWLVVKAVIDFGSGVVGLSVPFPCPHSTHDCIHSFLPRFPHSPMVGWCHTTVCSPSRTLHYAGSLWSVRLSLGLPVHPCAEEVVCSSSSHRGQFCLPHSLVGGSLSGFAHAASWESSLAGMNFCCVCGLLLISPMFWVVVVVPTIFGCGGESNFFFNCGLSVRFSML